MFQVVKIDFSKPTPMVYESTGFLSVRAWPLRYCELMQYTGLHDKNGKEIYEGDVVLFSDEIIADTICGSNRYETECYECEVLWGNGSWFIRQSVDQSEIDNDFLGEVASECEVIGNIHEQEE